MNIVVITTPGFDEKEIASIVKAYPDTQVIDFYTNDMLELAVIAKNRVMPEDTVLVSDGVKVVARLVGRTLATLVNTRAAVELVTEV